MLAYIASHQHTCPGHFTIKNINKCVLKNPQLYLKILNNKNHNNINSLFKIFLKVICF